MAENEVKVEAEKKVAEKVPTRTDLFKEHLQKILYQTIGVKVSKEKAWILFKNLQFGTVDFVLHQEDRRLPLAGVGTYEVQETKPRGSKAGLDKDGNKVEGAEAWPCVPKFKYHSSSVVDAIVEKAYGLGDHDDVVVNHYGLYKVEDDSPAEDTKKADKPVKTTKVTETTESSDVDEFAGLEDI